ncbi:cyclin-D5-1-like isoform X1 [Carya illinoinensis]|uniref:Uncharacterized protein n=1 Tax=Carya illinoinensis TaxID=32201 RepID=A0A8T1RF04_CARIL|nr:cyclin-D5-1-like isoform X1 [Carya illinoinensis]XP_042972732.1 cyclin-D5-1-like isoform X1 [Carya illinoinensis]KAG6666080.1 hypothetical protein CIPAW_01G005500 [Carya illinoinensis]
MGDSDTWFSPSSLLCSEGGAWLNEEGEEAENWVDQEPCFVSEDEDEYIEKLAQKESFGFGSKSRVPSSCVCSSTKSCLKCARLAAIEWIFNTRAIFGFKSHTAYIAITYFDQFLSKRVVEDGKLWAIELLYVACLTLAAKMEECKVPALSDFKVGGYNFENRAVKSVELIILSCLEWKLGSITPFHYLSYFINKFCDESRPKGLFYGAVEHILAITKETNLTDHRPSVIAAAAVLVAVDGQLSKKALELKTNVISLWGSQEKEHVFSCYNIMQNMEMGKVTTPKSVYSPNLSSMHSSSIDSTENSSSILAAGSKRRLVFTNSDQNCPPKRSR